VSGLSDRLSWRRWPHWRSALVLGAVLVAAVIAAALLAVASSGGPRSLGHSAFIGNALPNVDPSNDRDVGGAIDSHSVSRLELAWSDPFSTRSAYGSDASTPVVANGVIYSQDLASNVDALALGTGKLLWAHTYEAPDEGPNGVTVAAGRVYGATPTSAFALDQRTGRQLWSVTLANGKDIGIDMAPGYHDGVVYVSTVPVTAETQYAGGVKGVMWALDASTGRELWRFQTIMPTAGAAHSDVGGGGLWYTPAFDGSGGMYFGVGNPTPFPGAAGRPWGSGRPGPNLFSDSIVKLNAKTGALQWYYQLTPHDLYDWDLQDPPILTHSGGRTLVLIAGKGGFVLALDASTGKLVWKTSVGRHDGHDHDGLYAMRHEYSRLKTPATIYPGLLGGVIAPMSSNGVDVFVPVVVHSATVTSPVSVTEGASSSGEVVALSVATGRVRWRIAIPAPAFGATTVVNDLVLLATPQANILALDAATGREIWSASLPAGSNAGVMAAGDDLIIPAGLPAGTGQTPELVAYRVPAGK
jgi:outer membrane protein assembly factor BamB